MGLSRRFRVPVSDRGLGFSLFSLSCGDALWSAPECHGLGSIGFQSVESERCAGGKSGFFREGSDFGGTERKGMGALGPLCPFSGVGAGLLRAGDPR